MTHGCWRRHRVSNGGTTLTVAQTKLAARIDDRHVPRTQMPDLVLHLTFYFPLLAGHVAPRASTPIRVTEPRTPVQLDPLQTQSRKRFSEELAHLYMVAAVRRESRRCVLPNWLARGSDELLNGRLQR